MSRKNLKYQNNNKKIPYKGPFQKNQNETLLQPIKQIIRPESDGPTVDTFSDIDNTTNIEPNNDLDIHIPPNPKKRRPTKEKKRKSLFSAENIIYIILNGIISVVISGIISGISTVISYNNKFVSVEKDISHIQEEIKEQKTTIKELDNKIIIIDKNLELLNQKVDFQSNKRKNKTYL